MNLTSLDRRWIVWTCTVAVLCAIVIFGVSYTLIVLTVTVTLVLLFLYDQNNREQQSLNYFTQRDTRIGTDLNSDRRESSTNYKDSVFDSLQNIKRAFSNSFLSPIKEATTYPSVVNSIDSCSFKRPSSTYNLHSHHNTSDYIMASPFFKRGTIDRTSSKRRLSAASISSNSSKHTVPLVAVGSPLSPHTFLRSPSATTPALPRVRRVNSESVGRYDLRNTRSPAKTYGSPGAGLFPHTSGSGHGDYPTHLPQYNGLGILPKVHLHPVDKPLLTEHNSRLSSPVTVKIAPPDILKPPTPCVVIPEELQNEENKVPRNNGSQEAYENGREKRKRAMKDEEVEGPRGIIAPIQQDAKRRKFHEGTQSTITNGHSAKKESSKRSAAEAVRSFLQRLTGRKRKPALVEPDESILTDDEDAESVRESYEPPQSKKVKSDTSGPSFGVTGTPRNAIDVSYTSSRVLREDLNRSFGSRTRQSSWSTSVSVSRGGSGAPSRESSVPPGSAASSQATEKSLPPSGTSTPRRALGLDDEDDEEDVAMVPATSSTPVLEKSDKESKDKTKVKSSRSLFPSKKTGTLKLRSTLIKGDTLTDFSKVPMMQYKVTSEDYAQDRQADLERVRKMLENPDSTDQTDGKSEKPGTSGLPTQDKPSLISKLSSSATLPVSSLTSIASSSAASIATVSPLATSSSAISASDVKVSAIQPFSQTSQVTSTKSDSAIRTPTSQTDTAVKDGQSAGGFKIPVPTDSAAVTATSSTEQSKADATPMTSVATTLFSFKPVFSPSSTANSSTTSVSTADAPGFKLSGPVSTTTSAESKDTISPPSYSIAMAGLTPSFSSSISTPTTTPSLSSGTPLSSGGFSFQPAMSASEPAVSSSTPAPSFNFGQKISASSSASTASNSQLTSSVSSANLASLASSSGDSASTASPFTFGSQPSTGNAGSTPLSLAFKTDASLSSATSNASAASTPFAFGVTTTTTTASNAFTKTPQQPSSAPFMFGTTPSTATTKATTNTASPFTFGAGATSTPGFGATTTTTSTGNAAFTFGANATTVPSGTPAFGAGAPSAVATTATSAFKFGTSATSANTTPAFGSAATTTTMASSASPFTFGAASNTSTAPSNFAFKAGSATPAGPFGTSANAASTPFGSANSTAAATTATTNAAFGFGNISSSNLKPAAPGGSIMFGTANTATTTASSQSPFTFGAPANKPAASSGFNFGGAPAANTATTQATSSSFTFGASNSGGTPQTQSTNPSSFAFGAGAQSTNPAPFGNTSSTTSSPFTFGGSQTTTASSNAFGAPTSTTMSTTAQSKPFEFGKSANQGPGFAFGGNQTSQTASPFGQTNNTFGSTNAATGPFGSTSTAAPAFGNSTSNTFGTPAAVTPSKGFDFTASVAGQNSSFNFGQSPAVQFGAPSPAASAASPFCAATTPFNSASPAMPGADGMFSVGSGNTQARQRAIRTARRRTVAKPRH